MKKSLPESIVFFDLETTIPTCKGGKYFILEFASKEIRTEDWTTISEYQTLISTGANSITAFSVSKNNITRKMVQEAPSFTDVKDIIFSSLDGKVWAGHNIDGFDSLRIEEQFARNDFPVPKPLGTLDTLTFARRNFSGVAEGQSMKNLAVHFGFGEEYEKTAHRALVDVDFNITIFKKLLEPSNLIIGNIVPFREKRKLDNADLPPNKKAKSDAMYLEDVNPVPYFKRKENSRKGQQAVEYFNNGMSLKNIAVKLKLKESTIANYLVTFFVNKPLGSTHPFLEIWHKFEISEEVENACVELVQADEEMRLKRKKRDAKLEEFGVGFEVISLCRLKMALTDAVKAFISKEE